MTRRAYVLAELRCAALRARLWQADIDAVGLALNQNRHPRPPAPNAGKSSSAPVRFYIPPCGRFRAGKLPRACVRQRRVRKSKVPMDQGGWERARAPG
jgi:hypothetical protein